MVSLATVFAYEELEPIIAKLGCERPDDLRRDFACLIAYHSCRADSFARAYAFADLMACFGVDPWTWPPALICRHPLLFARRWWHRRKAAAAKPQGET